ncbi:MAG: DNA polymerase ligase N-terminal domain-containing protein [Limnospira sp.]
MKFVIQKHRASTEHYDFRLRVGDALKSWAVPKGFSTDPREKRLAIATEDHPVDYLDFEGVIPEDEYGAGTVMVWDIGDYRNLKDDSIEDAIADGHLTVWLEGKKIQGGYSLIRTDFGRDQESWMLVKMDDEKADARRHPVSTEPDSATTGRDLEEIREQSQ